MKQFNDRDFFTQAQAYVGRPYSEVEDELRTQAGIAGFYIRHISAGQTAGGCDLRGSRLNVHTNRQGLVRSLSIG